MRTASYTGVYKTARRGDVSLDSTGRVYGFNAWLKRMMKRRGEY